MTKFGTSLSLRLVVVRRSTSVDVINHRDHRSEEALPVDWSKPKYLRMEADVNQQTLW